MSGHAKVRSSPRPTTACTRRRFAPRVMPSVPGDSVAGNRGAAFVQGLAPALRAGTRPWTRLRSSAVRRLRLLPSVVLAGQRRD